MEFHVTNQSKHLKELYTMVQGSRQEVQQLKLASRNKDTAMEKMQRDMSAMQRRLDEMNGHITGKPRISLKNALTAFKR